MTILDPISDVIARIKNAHNLSKTSVIVPLSKYIKNFLEILSSEGYIAGFEAIPKGDSLHKHGAFRIELKYYLNRPVIRYIQKISKPSRRVYIKEAQISGVLKDLETAVISTSKGLMTGHTARSLRVGGEFICKIF